MSPSPVGRAPALGLVTILLGIAAIAAPWGAGEWSIALVGLFVLASGVIALLHAVKTSGVDEVRESYAAAVVAIVAGLLLFARPSLLLTALIRILAGLVILDGLRRLAQAIRQPRSEGTWSAFNGALNIVLGVLLWRYGPAFGVIAVAFVLGVWMISAGWRMLLTRTEGGPDARPWVPDDSHPDPGLMVPAHPEIGRITRGLFEQEHHRWRIDLNWVITLAVVFFLTHAGRMDLPWNIFGVASTAVAVGGDLVTAVLLTIVLLLPVRLLVRKSTRFLEASAWQRRLGRNEASPRRTAGDRLIDLWLEGRVRFALQLRQVRESFAMAVWRTLQDGLPLIAILIAVNPIWGFSWYFNSENWVTGVWQKLTETRVDVWRERMVEAVMAQSTGVPFETLFAIQPPGVAGTPDFSFLVIGDPGEGDASQLALRDRYLREGQRPDMKFVVVSSDVIYPAGAMRDYEGKFYLPFKGLEKPLYAIPGNHDWFDALEGFTANFLEPGAARAALRARREADSLRGSVAGAPVEAFVAEADRLRREYQVQTGLQRAPFFELQADRFALIAIDTGIRRRLDPRQRAWVVEALERARGRFTMVVLGHPLYAGGQAQGPDDPPFDEIHQLLRHYEVSLVMAGDTHDFEYYREPYPGRSGPAVMHHFVNGGGGAYLSIGTALDWPARPPVADWAFYPSTATLTAKLDAETPAWKRPLWWWVKYLGAWPSSPETLSGVFDFNQAPFFQSFAEIRVEGSAERVRVLMHGVQGRLRWRDLERGGQVMAEGRGLDDPVEFVIPLVPARATATSAPSPFSPPGGRTSARGQ